MPPDFAKSEKLNFLNLTGVILIHLGAMAAPIFFSWPGFWLCVLFVVVTGQLGISLGFHRLLAHRSFSASTGVKRFLAVLGTFALQAGPISWVAIHRLHHVFADRTGDPHSPLRSFRWAYIEWALFSNPIMEENNIRKWARDLTNDPILLFLEKQKNAICLQTFAIFFGMGYMIEGVNLGVSLVLWAGCVRIVYLWHVVFLINSVGHLWGYRNYAIQDNSQNSFLISCLAPGDGWQNNHHAFPQCANHGHRPGEFDPVFGIIKLLKALRLATKVIVRITPPQRKAVPVE